MNVRDKRKINSMNNKLEPTNTYMGPRMNKRFSKEDSKKNGAMEWIRSIVVALFLALLIMHFVTPTIVKQHSMEPNFHTDDYLFVNKQAYKLFKGTPELGDVIVFKSSMLLEDGTTKLLIKRVIGVPGNIVSIHDGKVYVDGEMLDDSYTKDQLTNGTIESIEVPDDMVFCLGDNRLVSQDSRSAVVGLIPYDKIVGKVFFRLFPLEHAGMIKNPYE